MSTQELAIPDIIIKSKKVVYLEGIRGVAAFMVVIHHFCLAFYPSLLNGVPDSSHLNKLELLYYSSPFIFLTNGQLFVYIFFILSGFVLSKKFFKEKDINYLVSASVRRFPRLFIPVAFSLIIAFLFLKCSLNYNEQVSHITKSIWFASLKGDPSFIHFLKVFFYKSIVVTDNSYITVLWSVSVELYGSFIVFSTLALTRNVKNLFFILTLLFVLFALERNAEYCAFIMGIMLNYSDTIKLKNTFFKALVIVILIITGCFLGGFPHIYYLSVPTIKGSFYSFLNYSALIDNSAFINACGAFLLILAVQLSAKLQDFFSSKALAFLGNISFSMYLIHTIILRSVTSFTFLKIIGYCSYNISFIISFISSIVIIFVLSYFMTIYVDKNSLVASKYVYNRFFLRKTGK